MNNWVMVRKATEEDHQRLEAAATRFINRHSSHPAMWGTGFPDAYSATEAFITSLIIEDERYTRKLWKAVVKRALRDSQAEGIAYGYVGYYG